MNSKIFSATVLVNSTQTSNFDDVLSALSDLESVEAVHAFDNGNTASFLINFSSMSDGFEKFVALVKEQLAIHNFTVIAVTIKPDRLVAS